MYDHIEYYDTRSMGGEKPDAWADRAREILNLLGTPQTSILDFGAGDGGLVAALRQVGVHAEGVESSITGRALAEKRGVCVHPDISSASSEAFSAVTMLHVLEHLFDPVATLAALRAILRPGGRLLVEVPNVTSVDALWPPVRVQILDLPFHLHHFTPRTLTAVVARAGFKPVAIRRFNPLALELALSHRRPRHDQSAGSALVESVAPPEVPPSSSVALWHRALPAVRSALPGMKLQLVASA